MSSSILVGLQVRSNSRTKRGIRLRRPSSPHDIIFGFAVRALIGGVAMLWPLVPVIIWGAINGWQITPAMLIFYGGLVAITVIVGEHLRSRIFERVLRSKSQRSHFELDQKLIYDALSDSDIPPQNASHIARRAFDIAFSFCGLWVMAPILIVVACIIKLESPRERVFFISQRRDVFGTSVRIIKFRTVGRDGHETRVGRQLRLSSLDEVPQFFVVLGGSMTLIGPRPLLNSPTVDQETRNLAKRYHIKPGLVDLAFWQGLKSSAYIAYTLNYAKQRTILSDIGIVWQTVVGARGLLRI